jgi:hypothetical protein
LFVKAVIRRDAAFLGTTLVACIVAAVVATFQYQVYASFVRSASVVPRMLGGDFWVTAASVECFDFPNPINEDYGIALARFVPEARFRRVVFGFAPWRSPTGQRGNVAVIGVEGTGLPDDGFAVDRSDLARLNLTAAGGSALASISDTTLHHAQTLDAMPTFLGAPYVIVPFERGRELLGMDPSSVSFLIGSAPSGDKTVSGARFAAAQLFPDVSIVPARAFIQSSASYWQNKTGAGMAILLAAALAALLMAILLTNGVLRFIQRYNQDLLSLLGHGASRRDIGLIVGIIAALVAVVTILASFAITPLLIAVLNPLLPWTRFTFVDALLPLGAVVLSFAVAMLAARRAIDQFGPEAVFRS